MKKLYSKPSLSRIELVAEQAALTACKVTALSAGPYAVGSDVLGTGTDCETGTGAQCFLLGS